MAVHDRGHLIAVREDATFAFCQPDGTPVPSSPTLPSPAGDLAEVHDAEITPETIIPPWHGERLDLDYAISTCLANERIREDRAAGRDADVTADPVFEPKPCLDPYCQSCFSWPRPSVPIQIPIPV
jgi:hypothetical protein